MVTLRLPMKGSKLHFWHSSSVLVGIAAIFVISAKPAEAQPPSPTPPPMFRSDRPTPTPTPSPPAIDRDRPKELVTLLNDARLAAPELAVDTFLNVVESRKIKDREWRREILEEAMRVADDVKYPVRKERAYFANGIVDTVSGYMSYAYDLGLDSLSIKARLIKLWLTEDKHRARDIVFRMRGDLALKTLTCEDPMTYVVDDIYVSVGAVAKETFTSKEIEDGVRGVFLLPWIENIQSPAQIVPVMTLLKRLNGPANERRLLMNAFERAIDRKFGDDRAFTYAFLRSGSEATAFVREADLSRVWRDFLAKNMAGPRCIESSESYGGRRKGELPQPAQSFNPLFPEDLRFTEKDFEGVEYKGKPNDRLYTDGETYKKISRMLNSAREIKNKPENKKSEAAQIEWEIRIGDVLEALDAWKATADESEAEVFNQKAVFFRSMMRVVTDNELNMTVVRAFMRFLADSPMQKDSLIEWLLHARWLADRDWRTFALLTGEFPNPNLKVLAQAKWSGIEIEK